MGDDRVGTTSVGKSVRSLLEALRSLENEVEVVFQRLAGLPSDQIRQAARLLRVIPRGVRSTALRRFFWNDPARAPARNSTNWLVELLGLADEASLDGLRSKVEALFEDVARIREREQALATGMSQLRARAARFDEALAGLARIQGRLAARMGTERSRTDKVERLASRRDDHITRLIRDTAAQRSQIEQLVSQIEAQRRRDRDTETSDSMVRVVDERMVAVARQFEDLRKAQKSGAQGIVDALETLRERLARLEARAVEMAREARAKTGRIDALARHVSGVESRLTSALGAGAGASVTTPIDRSDAASGFGQP